MKRFLLLLAMIVLPFIGTINVQALERSQMLKVYNWADYINPDVLNEFPSWYKEQTGEDVEIIYQTFDINESMCTQIEVGHEHYYVICPSDYMIERMLKAGLLQKINHDYDSTPDYTKLVSPFKTEPPVSSHFNPLGLFSALLAISILFSLFNIIALTTK